MPQRAACEGGGAEKHRWKEGKSAMQCNADGATCPEACAMMWQEQHPLLAEAVEGAALALEGVHNIHGSDGLALGVLGVGDGVSDDVLKEGLEHAAGFLVDEAADALHAASPRQPPDGGLGDALDVVLEHFAVALRPALAQAFAAFASPAHRVPLSAPSGALLPSFCCSLLTSLGACSRARARASAVSGPGTPDLPL